MRRRALAGITLSSFLLSILIGGVWLRSYIHLDVITRKVKNELHYKEFLLAWSRGRVTCAYTHRQSDPADVPAVLSAAQMRWDWDIEETITMRTGDSTANHFGFTALAGTAYEPARGTRKGATWTKYGFVLPCWFLFTMSLLLPGATWMRARRKAAQPAFPVKADSPTSIPL